MTDIVTIHCYDGDMEISKYICEKCDKLADLITQDDDFTYHIKVSHKLADMYILLDYLSGVASYQDLIQIIDIAYKYDLFEIEDNMILINIRNKYFYKHKSIKDTLTYFKSSFLDDKDMITIDDSPIIFSKILEYIEISPKNHSDNYKKESLLKSFLCNKNVIDKLDYFGYQNKYDIVYSKELFFRKKYYLTQQSFFSKFLLSTIFLDYQIYLRDDTLIQNNMIIYDPNYTIILKCTENISEHIQKYYRNILTTNKHIIIRKNYYSRISQLIEIPIPDNIKILWTGKYLCEAKQYETQLNIDFSNTNKIHIKLNAITSKQFLTKKIKFTTKDFVQIANIKIFSNGEIVSDIYGIDILTDDYEYVYDSDEYILTNNDNILLEITLAEKTTSTLSLLCQNY